MKRVAIFVPVYHSNLSYSENISIEQCKKVLGAYDIFYIIPKHIENDVTCLLQNGTIITVPDEYMSSVASYNDMMMREETYLWFLDYEYILIYQTDAFVFYDKLLYFCDLGFDYYGAPWITGTTYYTDIESDPVYYVGNGGFSLRKVQACIDILCRLKGENIDVYETIPEDLFWAVQTRNGFKVAPIDVALEFSIERYAEYCYIKNRKNLPFGCHQCYRFNIRFWRRFFQKEGYVIPEYLINGSIEDTVNPMILDYLIRANKTIIYYTLKNIIDNISIQDLKISIWGSGKNGEECGWLLLHNGIMIDRYIDSDKKRCGKSLWGTMIMSPYETKLTQNDIIIITPSKQGKEIYNYIASNTMLSESLVILYDEFRDELRDNLYQIKG